MSELYAEIYDSVPAGDRRLIPERLRRIAAAALFLGLVGAMALWAYRLGTRDAAEVPIIRAMEGPARVHPEDPGGLTAAHQGLEVNEVLAARPAPPPEAATLGPAPLVLAEEDGPQGELVIAAPPILPDAELAEGEDLRMPPQDEAPAGFSTGALVAQALGADAAAPQPSPDAPPGPADPLALAIEATEPAAAAGSRPMRRPTNLVRASAGAAAPPEAALGAREVASLDAGSRLVQLGAYDSEAITRQAWGQLIARHGDLLGAKSLYVERTTANARVFYRLRVAGFASAEATRDMCEALRARGVDCIPVTLQ